jgi:transcriptional regulator with XRE-family HTH domain
MSNEQDQRRKFASWLNGQLSLRGWTQGKLISMSSTNDEDRLSSAAVSRYSTGKMLPDLASCRKIAHAFEIPIDIVWAKAGFIEASPDQTDWIQQAIDSLTHAVDAGQISENGRLAIIAQILRERRLHELEPSKQ